MTSEIRANTLKNRVGLGTVSFTNTGPVVSGIVTIANSTTEGVTLEDNAGVGNSLKITTPTGYVSIGSGNSTFVHLNTDRGVFYFQKRIFIDEGIIASYDENLILQSPMNTNRITINKDTGLVSILNDLDVDGHTNLDHVNVSGTSTITGVLYPNNGFRVPNQVYSYFGSGNDLSIRHDESGGHHSYIFHHGAGVLKIGSDTQMILGETGPRNYIQMNPNSDVKLYFNNNPKLATSNTGVTVTGTVAATSYTGDGSNLTGITQTTINNNANLRLISGDANANELNAEPNLTFDGQTLTAHMSTANPAVFVGDSNRTSAGQHVAEYRGYWDGNQIGRIVFAAGDDTTNKDDGIIKFHTTQSGGSITERLRIDSSGRLVLSNSDGIQLSPQVSNMYQVNGALSYYAANNAVYLNGAGDSGVLRLNATGTYNDRTCINIMGKDVSGDLGDALQFRTKNVERLLIKGDGNVRVTSGVIENSKTISSNYTVSTDYNAMSAGPMSIANGVSVTVPSGSAWTIV